MKNKEKELIKNTTIVSVGRLCTQLITFFLLPLYTSILSTEEYGIVDLLNTLVGLFLPIITFQIEQGIFRFLIERREERDKQETLISTSLIIVLCQVLAFGAIFVGFSFFIANEYKYFLALNLLAHVCSSILLQITRGMGDNLKYAKGSFISAVTTVVLNVLFVAGFRWAAYGMLIATFLGHMTCAAYILLSKKILSYFHWKLFDKKLAAEVLKYSFPLIPNMISWWVINASNRTVITSYLGLAFNGIFSAAAKFSSLISTLYSVFNLAWTESAALYIDSDDADSFFSNIFDIIIRLFGCVCMCVIVFMPFVFDIMIDEKFADAYYQIPILMVGALFNIFVSFLGSIYVAKKITGEIAKTSILAALINISLNVILIRFIGLYAASIATAVSYMAMFIYRLVDSKKYIRLTVNKKLFITVGILYILSIAVYYLDIFAVSIAWAVIAAAAVLLINKKTIMFLLDFVKSKKHPHANK